MTVKTSSESRPRHKQFGGVFPASNKGRYWKKLLMAEERIISSVSTRRFRFRRYSNFKETASQKKCCLFCNVPTIASQRVQPISANTDLIFYVSSKNIFLVRMAILKPNQEEKLHTHGEQHLRIKRKQRE